MKKSDIKVGVVFRLDKSLCGLYTVKWINKNTNMFAASYILYDDEDDEYLDAVEIFKYTSERVENFDPVRLIPDVILPISEYLEQIILINKWNT